MQTELESSTSRVFGNRSGRSLFSRSRLELLLLSAFSIFYFADVLLRASEKYFWYDEITTVCLSRLNPGALWVALRTAVDNNPPLFYWLTRAGEALAGENKIGARLPEIIAFWAFCLCMYGFVRRRAGIVAGLIAMLFPMCTGAFFYAYEARPHAIVLGLAGLSAVCWQNAYERKRRTLWLVLLSLCLFGAFMNHCFALLLVFPFALAELFQMAKTRRFDLPLWAALIIPALAVVPLYLPLVQAAHKLWQGTQLFTAFPPSWSQPARFYNFLLNPAFLILIFALLLLLVHEIFESSNRLIFSAREAILAAGFLALPIVSVVLGKAVNAPYVYRYLLSTLLGFCFLLAVPFGSARLLKPNLTAVALAAVLFLYAGASFSRLAWHRIHGVGEILFESSSSTFLDTTPGNPLANESLLWSASDQKIPIATRNAIQFLHIVYYAPGISRRLYYVAPGETDVLYRWLGTFERFGPAYNAPEKYWSFINAQPRCYLWGGPEVVQSISELLARGWQLRSLQTFQGQNLAVVENPRPPE